MTSTILIKKSFELVAYFFLLLLLLYSSLGHAYICLAFSIPVVFVLDRGTNKLLLWHCKYYRSFHRNERIYNMLNHSPFQPDLLSTGTEFVVAHKYKSYL